MSDIELDIDDLVEDFSDVEEVWSDDEISILSESEHDSDRSDSDTDASIDPEQWQDESYDPDQESEQEFITVPRLSKYEKANIIGTRASQLQAGALPLVNLNTLSQVHPISIATAELEQHKLNFLKIKRILPSGKPEIISLKHFIH